MALKRELPTDNKAADISEGVGGLQGDKDIAKGDKDILCQMVCGSGASRPIYGLIDLFCIRKTLAATEL